MSSSAPVVEYTFRGPIHARIERHNHLIELAGSVRGYAVVCAGTRVACYLALFPGGIKRVCCPKMLAAIPTMDESGVWIQDEQHATIAGKHEAAELMCRHANAMIWRFSRLVAVGDTGLVVFDFPTIGGL